MRKSTLLSLILLPLCILTAFANQPDSAYIFSYTNENKPNGLHFAWSLQASEWHPKWEQ